MRKLYRIFIFITLFISFNSLKTMGIKEKKEQDVSQHQALPSFKQRMAQYIPAWAPTAWNIAIGHVLPYKHVMQEGYDYCKYYFSTADEIGILAKNFEESKEIKALLQKVITYDASALNDVYIEHSYNPYCPATAVSTAQRHSISLNEDFFRVSTEQKEFIFCHELGHIVNKHTLKALGVAIALPILTEGLFALGNYTCKKIESKITSKNIRKPLAWLRYGIFDNPYSSGFAKMLISVGIWYAYVRSCETQADQYAVKLLGSARGAQEFLRENFNEEQDFLNKFEFFIKASNSKLLSCILLKLQSLKASFLDSHPSSKSRWHNLIKYTSKLGIPW